MDKCKECIEQAEYRAKMVEASLRGLVDAGFYDVNADFAQIFLSLVGEALHLEVEMPAPVYRYIDVMPMDLVRTAMKQAQRDVSYLNLQSREEDRASFVLLLRRSAIHVMLGACRVWGSQRHLDFPAAEYDSLKAEIEAFDKRVGL